MALVTLPSGEQIEETEGPTLDYYRGEGYPVTEDAAPISFPRVYDGGDSYLGEQVVETASELSNGNAVGNDADAQTESGISAETAVAGIDTAKAAQDENTALADATNALTDAVAGGAESGNSKSASSKGR